MAIYTAIIYQTMCKCKGIKVSAFISWLPKRMCKSWLSDLC